MSILDYAPPGFTLRESQVKTLLDLEANWDAADVFIIDTPVGGGKTVLGMTIMAWYGAGSYIVPNNVLLDQVIGDFPNMPYRKSRDSYICPKGSSLGNFKWTCEKQKKACKGYCPGCPSVKDRIRDETSNFGAYNYFGYYSNKRHRDLLVVDESHALITFLRELHTKRLWKDTYGWPEGLTEELLLAWVKEERKRERGAGGKKKDSSLLALESCLMGRSKKNLTFRSKEPRSGGMGDVIKVVPAICNGEPIWRSDKVSKIVLMSATLSDLDIRLLGLSGYETVRLVSESPIPPQNRPVAFTRDVAMRWDNREEGCRILASSIQRIAGNHVGESGIVHLPYSLVPQMRELLGHDPRYIFHEKDARDKKQKLEFYLNNPGHILMACGMSEGVDLKYDKARFNIITKANFANKEDNFVKAMTARFRQWPAEQAIKHLLQAYGRSTRSMDDYSITYILDTVLWDLYNESRASFPEWFNSAVITNED